MRRIISLLLALTMCLALCACGEPEPTNGGNSLNGGAPTGGNGNSSLPTTGQTEPEHKHTYQETDRVEATKTADGSVTYTCVTCNDSYTEVLPATGSVGLEYSKNYDDTYSVVGVGSCTDTDIVIPALHEGVRVTRIGEEAFKDNSDLISIKIPATVTRIGYYAFENCTNLTSVTIPDGVTTISTSTFANCTSLTNIMIPDSVTEIYSSAFYNCSSLTSITIPDSVTGIGDFAFTKCSNLTSATLGSSITEIGEAAFRECSSLGSITIPASVTYIGPETFKNCSSLTGICVDENNADYCSDASGVLYNKNQTVLIVAPGMLSGDYVIPASVTEITQYAFYCCNMLTGVTISDGVTEIREGTFSQCESLASVILPDSLIAIRDSAFSKCNNLTSITIPYGVHHIGDSAFSSGGLVTVYIPSSVNWISDGAFSWCFDLTSIYYGGTKTMWNSSEFYRDREWDKGSVNYTMFFAES